MNLKFSIYVIVYASVLMMLNGCTTESMQASANSKQGFSNVRDIPLPQTATVDMNKSMVVGGGDSRAVQ